MKVALNKSWPRLIGDMLVVRTVSGNLGFINILKTNFFLQLGKARLPLIMILGVTLLLTVNLDYVLIFVN